MTIKIKTIRLGGVNCYLVNEDDSYFLIDTGFASKRVKLEKELEEAGLTSKNFKLIILTHGDSDHADNCAFLREKYGVIIAMHKNDSQMVERGDMTFGRKDKPDKISTVFSLMIKMSGLNKSSKFDTFKPDLYFEEGQDLSEFGFDAKILHLPGHSKGSIGILTIESDLFCGDLIYNFAGFKFIDDMPEHKKSIQKLKKLVINTVYPGHGNPFLFSAYIKRENK